MEAYFQQLALIMLCGLPAWLILRRPWTRRPVIREVVLALFVLFMVGLMCFTLEGKWAAPAAMLESALNRIPTMDRIWLKPFNTIIRSAKRLHRKQNVLNIFGNIFMFTPWGFGMPLLWKRFRHFWWLVLLSLGLTLFIECTQLFIDRFVETDDVILNFLGSMLGAGLWWIVHRVFPCTDVLAAPLKE